jgi:hypothetical protein
MSNTATSIETSTGRYVDLLAPDPATIVLADIAAHLSRIGRYNGACQRYMSVAEHAILVADRVRSQGAGARTILLALHHDSAEAYCNDRTRPYKIAVESLSATMPTADEEIEERVDRAIRVGLGIPAYAEGDYRTIKAADNWALAAEAWHLLPSRGIGWVSEGLYDPDDPSNPPMAKSLAPPQRMTPGVAEGLFIGQHNRWTGMLADVDKAAA